MGRPLEDCWFACKLGGETAWDADEKVGGRCKSQSEHRTARFRFNGEDGLRWFLLLMITSAIANPSGSSASGRYHFE